VRDWLFVEDHAAALITILTRGRVGESYNVGGEAERTNVQVVEQICDILDARTAPRTVARRRDLIRFVADRPGHDRRYAIDETKARAELGYAPARTFDQGFAETLGWYLANEGWWRAVIDGSYRDWVATNYTR